MITKEDLQILIEMEELSHELINKHITKEYNEEGEIINPEYELWTKYWNLVERLVKERRIKSC